MVDKKIETGQDILQNQQFGAKKELLDVCKTYFPKENISETSIGILFKNITEKDRADHGSTAIKNLAVDFMWEDINPYIVETEINVLKKYNKVNNTIADKEKQEGLKHKQYIQIQTTFLETKMNYNFLDDQYKASPEQLDNFRKNKSTPDIEQKLQQANINIDDYMAFWYAAEEISRQSSELTEEQIIFINQFNNFNRTLDIDYQITIPVDKLRNAPKPNNLSDVIKAPDTIFAYPSVREYTTKQPNVLTNKNKLNINPELQQDIRSNTPKKQQEELRESIKKNCIQNQLPIPVILSGGDSRSRSIQDNKKTYNLFGIEKIDGEVEQNIQHIIDIIIGSYAHDYLITQTNAFAKKSIISQAVAGLAHYFDTTTDDRYTPGMQNYASDFDLSDNGNIDIQDNVLHISGKMYGQIVHFFYNLETGELQANDYLYKVMEAQSFFINDPRGRVTLPTTLPSISTLQSQIQSVNYQDMINKSDSRKTYQTKLQKQSNTTLSKNFENNNYNKLYVQRMNEKNLFIQETLDIINQSVGGDSRNLRIAAKIINLDNSPSPIEITRSLHPNEYELLMLLDRTSQHYRSPDQLRTIRQQLKDIMNNTNIKEGTHPDPVLNKLFREESLIQDQENWNNPAKKSNFLLFIDLISNKKNQFGGGIIDISLLGKIVDRINKKEILLQKSDPRHFKEKYEKILDSNV